MKQAVRAIVINKDKLLVMKRNKFGHEYYTLIGGHVELGESVEVALHREVHEETMMDIANRRLVYIESASAPYGDQYIFLCDYVTGDPVLSPEADERQISALGDNIYQPMWLPIDKLASVPFRSDKLQKRLIKHIADGFPDMPEHFSSRIS